ncbi:MAG TPA: rhamnogalacturonan acetylesterase [Pyrinomonadaceae bacterium]|nr:rhamnogalacturonan acetylesterase [Pyrinomonadaceae bacterium]HRA41742.1 rhamnogalacturonan acetylesterase [Pyrinomonadaceae bacterium]
MRLILAIVLVLLFALLLSASASAQLTVFLAGDSTAANKAADRRPETGWGEMLQQHFDPAKVKIDNRALNGRSTKSFVDEGHWQKIVDALKKGDFVFIEFGHNDEKKDKPAVYASPDDYKANLARFIRDVRAKGATPVLMTPVSRRKFENEVLVKTHGEYPEAVKAVGKAENAAVIDMESKSAAVMTRYGKDGSTKLFLQLKPGEHPNYPKGVEDNTHFSPLGAEEMAKLAVEGIRENKIMLTKYLRK